MQVIAIIPAKGNSERCPGKNTRSFLGCPLFLYSVFYAQAEGIFPVVSTDSEDVIKLCKDYGITVVKEQVDDATMCNCVRQVLDQVHCDYFAILQPTSPLRKQGLLRKMISDLLSGSCESAFTASDIKIIGQLDGHFRRAYRDQDAKDRFMFFDGNISVASRAFFERTGELFDDDSRSFTNVFPCTSQINTEDDFVSMEQIASHENFRQYLPKNVRRICIVSNRHWFARNYSDFVDSCDLVIRVSKMENLYTGLTGSRTDMAVVSCHDIYLNYSREYRKVDVLKTLPIIYFDPWSAELTKSYCKTEGLKNWTFIPSEADACAFNFTTFGKSIVLANWLYPQAHIFCLGDNSVAVRTDNSTKHVPSGETAYVQTLEKEGVLTWILEDSLESTTGVYSTSIPDADKEQIKAHQLYLVPDTIPHRTVTLEHTYWKDTLRIAGSVACRAGVYDAATVIKFNDDVVCLKWHQWGDETFVKQNDGSYLFIQ